jgi:predicted nuclease of restriction endonuclease-like (RecB) superfamily
MRQDNPQARVYYLREATAQGWSVRQLERHIQTHSFKRLIKAGTASLDSTETPMNRTFIKDPYVLEFLNLPEHEPLKETQFEKAIIANLQQFLLEMGRGFSFVGRQYRISTETSHFYVDLVFYNFVLKCFVLIDLKTNKLSHQDIGQMDMYVRMFDDLKRNPDDNPTIGIILCNDKEETVVRYSVLAESEQLFASKYRLVLPTEEELEEELAREVRAIGEAEKLDKDIQ